MRTSRPSKGSKNGIYVNSEVMEHARDVHRTYSGLSQMESQDGECKWTQVPIPLLQAVSN